MAEGQPVFWEILSGPAAILTRAFLWCGWAAKPPVDWCFDDKMDISDPGFRKDLRSQLGFVHFWWMGIECSSMSRAREKPLPWKGAPQPLRSPEFPDGLHGLQERDARRVKDDNSNADFLCQLMDDAAAGGAGACAENPRNSYLWMRGRARMLIESKNFAITDYDACCHEGARCKRQRLCHTASMYELHAAISAVCAHVHSASEWQAVRDSSNNTYYPTADESAYTAGFALRVAVAASHWAVRVGVSKLRLPRIIPPVCHGDRTAWLQLPKESLRENALPARALALGLIPPLGERLDWMPVLHHAPQWHWDMDNVVYIGPGNATFQRSASKWSMPLMPGRDGSRAWCIYKFQEHLRGKMCVSLCHLANKWLWCDCQQVECHGYTVMAAVYHHLQQVHEKDAWHYDLDRPLEREGGARQVKASPKQSNAVRQVKASSAPSSGQQKRTGHPISSPARKIRSVIIASSVAASQALPLDLGVPQGSHPWGPKDGPVALLRASLPWQQDPVCNAVRSMCLVPDDMELPFPFVEDLLSGPPFSDFGHWLQNRECNSIYWQPNHLQRYERRIGNTWTGVQGRAHNMSGSHPPLLPFNLSKDEHFKRSCSVAERPSPLESSAHIEPDLLFAADAMVTDHKRLVHRRDNAVLAIKELSKRLEPTSAAIRTLQPACVRKVAGSMHLALLAVLVLVLQWPDTMLVSDFVRGFRVVGNIPNCGVYGPSKDEFIDEDGLLKNSWLHATLMRAKSRRVPAFQAEHAQTILEATEADISKGFAEPMFTWGAFCSNYPAGTFRTIRRFPVLQSSGKVRPCDDGDGGGHTDLTCDDNKLSLCNALQPAVHIRALHQAAEELEVDITAWDESVETGGEDWPDAYRFTPFWPEHRLLAVVMLFHPKWKDIALVIYNGLLFGLKGAVIAFNRYSLFTERMSRRLLAVLISLYFDDATIQDWGSCRGSAQAAVQQVQTLLGRPFALEKRQDMSLHGDFLGLTHDLTRAMQGHVSFTPRQKLVERFTSMAKQAKHEDYFPPGLAAKASGLWNFLQTGVFGQVGRACLQPIQSRQYLDLPPFKFTPSLRATFDMLQAILATEFERVVPVRHTARLRFAGASDAAADDLAKPSGGFLIAFLPGVRLAAVVDLNSHIKQWMNASSQQIAQWELFQVLAAILAYPDAFRNRSGVWWIDNAPALCSLVKGKSGSSDMDKMTMVIHLLLFSLGCTMFFEYVPSDSNWADGISRQGFDDPWHKQHKFLPAHIHTLTEVLDLNFACLARVFSFL